MIVYKVGIPGDQLSLNDGTNYDSVLYGNGYGLPQINPKMILRDGFHPVFGVNEYPERTVYVSIVIRKSTLKDGHDELAQYFEPDHPYPVSSVYDYVRLSVVNDDGVGNERYWKIVCKSLQVIPGSNGWEMLATCQIVEDNLLRRWSPQIDLITVTASGQSQTIDNDGDAKSDPLFRIIPKTAKAVGFLYQRFYQVDWRSENAGSNYSTDITNNAFDTAALTPAKMQADGDDLRVFVDGQEVDRWLDGMDTSTTKVWVNLDFDPDITLTLTESINSSVDELQVDEDISGLPSTNGIIRIGTELIQYGSKSVGDKKFLDCARGAKYTTAASHTAAADITWIQHDIWIKYGNAALAAPDVDDNKKPQFNLATSLNTSWDYDEFTDLEDPVSQKSGRWTYSGDLVVPYSHTHGAKDVGDYEVLGLKVGASAGGGIVHNQSGRWQIYQPVGITTVNFANGEKIAGFVGDLYPHCDILKGHVGHDYIAYQVPDVTASDTWQSWSYSSSLSGTYTVIALTLDSWYNKGGVWVECADVTLTLNSSFTPSITEGAEQGVYELDVRLLNNDTGDEILVNLTCKLDEFIWIDCREKRVYNNTTGENHFGALTIVDGPRKHWMRLDLGTNQIYYYETGVVSAQFYYSKWQRYYQ